MDISVVLPCIVLADGAVWRALRHVRRTKTGWSWRFVVSSWTSS